MLDDVACGSKGDLTALKSDFRFTSEKRHQAEIAGGPFSAANNRLRIEVASGAVGRVYETRFTPGGCHVPSPAGRIEGGVVFGQ
jgi:hypothetical protein